MAGEPGPNGEPGSEGEQVRKLLNYWFSEPVINSSSGAQYF